MKVFIKELFYIFVISVSHQFRSASLYTMIVSKRKLFIFNLRSGFGMEIDELKPKKKGWIQLNFEFHCFVNSGNCCKYEVKRRIFKAQYCCKCGFLFFLFKTLLLI